MLSILKSIEILCKKFFCTKYESFFDKSPSLFLLRKIRDEVHRFSIEYHRTFRNTQISNSHLMDIQGLGKKRYQILFKKYKSINKITLQTPEKINLKTKIPIKVCREIFLKLGSAKKAVKY